MAHNLEFAEKTSRVFRIIYIMLNNTSMEIDQYSYSGRFSSIGCLQYGGISNDLRHCLAEWDVSGYLGYILARSSFAYITS